LQYKKARHMVPFHRDCVPWLNLFQIIISGKHILEPIFTCFQVSMELTFLFCSSCCTNV
jgi:hypothetical protein